jgi:hypothetical protein
MDEQKLLDVANDLRCMIRDLDESETKRNVAAASDRNKGDLVLVQVIKNGEQTAGVTVQAVNGIHVHDIEVVQFSTRH